MRCSGRDHGQRDAEKARRVVELLVPSTQRTLPRKKSPLTSLRGAVERIDEGLDVADARVEPLPRHGVHAVRRVAHLKYTSHPTSVQAEKGW